MKHYNKFWLAIAASALLASCADDFKSEFNVDKPENVALYEYLNSYDALKTYINRSTNPNFKLGAGTTVSDFLKKELVYSAACANFDELTAGNAMKYNACVNDAGVMDFSQVAKFVDVAQNAGLTIYGHTLCWHAQQQNGYLNGLIAPTVIPGTGNSLNLSALTDGTFTNWGKNGGSSITTEPNAGIKSGSPAVKLISSATSSSAWSMSLSTPTINIIPSNNYVVSFNIKSNQAGKGRISFSEAMDNRYPWVNWDGSATGEAFATNDTWKEIKFTVGPAGVSKFKDGVTSFGFTFDLGYLPNVTYYIDVNSLSVVNANESNAPTVVEFMANGNFETNNETNYQKNGDAVMSYTAAGEGSGGVGRALKVVNESVRANDYNAQLILKFAQAMKTGETYEFKMDVRADAAASFPSQAQSAPGAYLHWTILGDIPVTTTWTTFTYTIKVDGNTNGTMAIAFNLGKIASSFYFDNVSLTTKKESSTGTQIIEKTDGEKKEILTNALATWIEGMMKACNGYVKAWDVVNEPMSDGNASELKSDPNHTDTDNFYWQDYLGKGYARDAIKLARQYGGNDLKLFINDYNLEATYNNNAKCVGLINMVAYWESDGITKVDGLGTQMHVSYNMDAEKQQKQEDCIVKMYQLLAATGKLIKVSELDMGILDASGNAIKTVNVTFAQQQLMSNFYKFIVKKYFEIIPVAQQYGITQWSPTDSPDGENSFWRKGEPIGLWNEKYNRKPVYAGFTEGLSGK